MDFNDVLNETISSTIGVLAQKATEYATTKSRYHNFEVAGRKRNCTPEEALMGMKVKHDVAVDDLVSWVEESPEKLTLPLIDEKIGDSINYLILLKGMLINRVEANRAMEDVIIQEEASRDFPEDKAKPSDELRISKKDKWTSNFTPPIDPYTDPVLDYVCKTITFPQGTNEDQKLDYFKKHPMIERERWRELQL